MKNTDKVQEIAGVFIYPKEYFCPKDYTTGKMNITENSYSIHWYTASWSSYSQKLKKIILKICLKFKIINK